MLRGASFCIIIVINVVLQIRIGTSESKEKRQEYQLKLASLHQKLANFSDATEHLQQLLHGPLAYTEQAQRLHVECQLADLHVRSLQFVIITAACQFAIDPLRCAGPQLTWGPSLWALSCLLTTSCTCKHWFDFVILSQQLHALCAHRWLQRLHFAIARLAMVPQSIVACQEH